MQQNDSTGSGCSGRPRSTALRRCRCPHRRLRPRRGKTLSLSHGGWRPLLRELFNWETPGAQALRGLRDCVLRVQLQVRTFLSCGVGQLSAPLPPPPPQLSTSGSNCSPTSYKLTDPKSRKMLSSRPEAPAPSAPAAAGPAARTTSWRAPSTAAAPALPEAAAVLSSTPSLAASSMCVGWWLPELLLPGCCRAAAAVQI